MRLYVRNEQTLLRDKCRVCETYFDTLLAFCKMKYTHVRLSQETIAL